MFSLVSPVMCPSVRGLCAKPYPGHPKGCPNFYKKRFICPPQSKLLTEIYDFTKPLYFIWNVFNIEEHMLKMKIKHPTWSDRQLFNVLYWQPQARKQLRQHIKDFSKQYPDLFVWYCPEGSGCDVTATMKQIGITLEWPPRKLAYQVAVAGTLI